ncbi:MAG: AarF/ABC1/UbiB kinase family protein [Gammaproteobacteria bacterium]|nr:AarF/ABC1/UbiB kinase family protein [Gammaproteobacteria bacterium]
MLTAGAKTVAAGDRLRANDLLLTPGNARHVADRLSKMRGAAMKVGQLLSMEAGEYLPAELTRILASLRENAHPMPLGQVAKILESAWGSGWDREFRQFSFTPLAAASIGQVHEATTKDARHLAIKVQYPGIRESIDSDVDNVSALFRLFRLVPGDYDIAALLQEAKQQLHMEADYYAEAEHIAEFGRLIGDDPGFSLPVVDGSRTTTDVLTMSFVPGVPIEAVADQPQPVRDRVATRLLELVLKEVFEWRLVQTDANFANYRYATEQDRIGLLDFGATRRYAAGVTDDFRRLMHAAVTGQHGAIETQAVRLGYFREHDASQYRQAMCDMISTVATPVRHPRPFDFAASDLGRRVAEQAASLRLRRRYMHLPPTDLLFLHRKFAGTYLLCARLRAQVDVAQLVAPYLQGPTPRRAE